MNPCVLTTQWRLLFIIRTANTVDNGHIIIQLIISLIYNTSFTQYTTELQASKRFHWSFFICKPFCCISASRQSSLGHMIACM